MFRERLPPLAAASRRRSPPNRMLGGSAACASSGGDHLSLSESHQLEPTWAGAGRTFSVLPSRGRCGMRERRPYGGIRLLQIDRALAKLVAPGKQTAVGIEFA